MVSPRTAHQHHGGREEKLVKEKKKKEVTVPKSKNLWKQHVLSEFSEV
jgi:hypothetical protein